MYKEDDDSVVKRRSVNGQNSSTVEEEENMWECYSIAAWKTQINVFMTSPGLHNKLCQTFDSISKYACEKGFVTNDFADCFAELLNSFGEMDAVEYDEPCIHFFNMLAKFSELDNGLKLLDKINIMDYIAMMFIGEYSVFCIPQSFDILTSFAKDSTLSLIRIYKSIPFFKAVETWLPYQSKEDKRLFLFLLESLTPITPVETMQTIMVFVSVKIRGNDFLSNMGIVVDIIYSLLIYGTFDNIKENFCKYEFPQFILFCLGSEAFSKFKTEDDREKNEIIKSALKCTRRIVMNMELPYEDYLDNIMYVWNNYSDLKYDCIKTVLAIIVNSNEGIMLNFIGNAAKYHEFVECVVENFVSFSCKEKTAVSDFLLFLLLHIGTEEMMVFIESFDLFSIISESFTFGSLIFHCISVMNRALITKGKDFPIDDDNVQSIIELITDIKDNEESDENIMREATKFLENIEAFFP